MSAKNDIELEVMGSLTEDCKFIEITHSQLIKRVIRKLVGEPLVVKFKKFYPKRSDRQNRYLYGVVIPCIAAWYRENTGVKIDKEDVKDWVYRELLGATSRPYVIGGVEYHRYQFKRFSQMTTMEFTEAVETIRDKMAEFDCHIPAPTRNNFITDFTDE